MAIEKVRNLAEDELASGYTSGGSSISVSDASLFPTTGTFRVALGNADRTIFRVDSVSGTTFTGAAEFADANASAADTVTLVGSRGTFERLLQSPDSGEAFAYSGVDGADRYGPIWKSGALDASAWSWVNQGSAALTTSGGVGTFSMPSAVGTNHRGKYVSAPGTPYTVTIKASYFMRTADFSTCGIALRESGTSKVIIFGLANNSGVKLNAGKFTNDTTFSSDNLSAAVAVTGDLFLRVADNGTNVIFSYSLDGVNFNTHLSETRGTFFTTAPNQYGLAGNNSSGTTILFGATGLLVA